MELSPQPMVKLGVVHLLMKEKHHVISTNITMKFPPPITKVDHFLWGFPKQCLYYPSLWGPFWEQKISTNLPNKKIQVYSHPCHSDCWWLYIFMDSTSCWNSRRFWLTRLSCDRTFWIAPLAALIAALKEITSLPDSVCPEEICQEFIWNFEGYRLPAANPFLGHNILISGRNLPFFGGF